MGEVGRKWRVNEGWEYHRMRLRWRRNKRNRGEAEIEEKIGNGMMFIFLCQLHN